MDIQELREALKVERAARLAAETEVQAERSGRLVAEGRYYSTLDQVWGRQSARYERKHFDALFRDHCLDEDVVTLAAAIDDNNIAADESSSSRSSKRSKNKEIVWPTDIFGNEILTAEMAHLIPASDRNSDTYDEVAAWVVGYKEQNDDVRMKLIHGSRPSPAVELPAAEPTATVQSSAPPAVFPPTQPSALQQLPASRPSRLKQVIAPLQKLGRNIRAPRRPAPLPADPPPSAERNQKVRFSGLKHSALNLIRLLGQRDYMDNNPCVVIVPAMTKDDLLNWKSGQSYTAIVLVEGWPDRKIKAENAALLTGMAIQNQDLPADQTEATKDEVEMARMRLTEVLHGLAYSLSRRTPEFREKYNLFNIEGNIFVPSASGSQPEAFHHVRKVIFGLPGLHPAPDPLLLAVKAALVWSVRNEQRLLAGGEQKDDDGSSIESDEIFNEGVVQPLPDSLMSRDACAVDSVGDSQGCLSLWTGGSGKPPMFIDVPMQTVKRQRDQCSANDSV